VNSNRIIDLAVIELEKVRVGVHAAETDDSSRQSSPRTPAREPDCGESKATTKDQLLVSPLGLVMAVIVGVVAVALSKVANRKIEEGGEVGVYEDMEALVEPVFVKPTWLLTNAMAINHPSLRIDSNGPMRRVNDDTGPYALIKSV
jgi:hypothetical protein